MKNLKEHWWETKTLLDKLKTNSQEVNHREGMCLHYQEVMTVTRKGEGKGHQVEYRIKGLLRMQVASDSSLHVLV